MSLRGKKLGLLVSAAPDAPNFLRGLKLAEAALDAGVMVYLYCIDDAVNGIGNAKLQSLKARGLNLYACAYGAQRRDVPTNDSAVFAGLTVVSDIIGGTERFLSFN